MKDAIEAGGRLWVKEGKGFGPMTHCYRIHKIGRIHRSENTVHPMRNGHEPDSWIHFTCEARSTNDYLQGLF